MMQLAIYGAQGIALGAYEAIKDLYPQREVKCFIVTEIGNNALSLGGLPVIELNKFAEKLTGEEKENVEILIATPETVMSEIEEELNKKKFSHHTRLTSLRWAQLVSYHFAKEGEFVPLASLPVGCHKTDIHLFMAKYYKDKVLQQTYELPEWVNAIQVGAALCEKRVADVLDCNGDNISEKNGNYSELTALYWIWKNELQRPEVLDDWYYGLCHYRRILHITEDDISRLIDNDVDAVLPYPLSYEPNIEAHHIRYIQDEDWNAVLEALKELNPEYATRLPEIFAQKYFFNYNIILAKKCVLKDYCGWLFPILERVEELSVPKGRERCDRYIGYIGETLSTLYFLYNKEKLNIVHTGCLFLT